MIKRVFGLAVIQCGLVLPICFAADGPPSEASVKQLLEVSQVHKILDNTMAQMDGFMKQALQQATQGQSLTPQIKTDIEKRQAEMMSIFKDVFDWHKLEPMYVRVYQKSFTQSEIDNLIAMYKTPGGQALLNKMPVVMQNTMTEMQQLMRPMFDKIQRMQKEVASEIQAEKNKSG
jgi:uncharacterized protein